MYIETIWKAISYILPAYFANATPVISRGRRPVDFNRTFIDGQPIFGKNKTIEGFLVGLLAGSMIAYLQGRLLLGFMLALGALLGDLAGSFIKRRLKIVPGGHLPILDQLDFIAGSLLLSSLFSIQTFETITIIVVLTPPLHMITNRIAYLLGLKSTAW